MNAPDSNSFSYSFNSSKSPDEIFNLLLDIDKWWSGIYNETIKGKSQQVNDEFSFSAGSGAHNSNQKLVELIPGRRVGWLVTDSNLTFLNEPNEWANTKIGFDISPKGNQTSVTFTHEGLTPTIECYDSCSGGWTQYLKKLEEKLK